jgi:hypothetical protein
VRVSARSKARASPFVTTPYWVSPEGTVAVLPGRGSCWDRDRPCQVERHDRRARKTGPEWGWVAVARCRAHGRAFTIYPPGHVPYGRVPLVELAPDGSAVRRNERDGPSPVPETLLLAASDAAKGKRWPREEAREGSVRSTQRRRVALAAVFFGLLSGKTPRVDTVAAVTQLPEGVLVETIQVLAASSDFELWGRKVTSVAVDLADRAGRVVMDRLAVLGHLAGSWGRPFRWEPRSGRLLKLGQTFWRTGSPGTDAPELKEQASSRLHDYGARASP